MTKSRGLVAKYGRGMSPACIAYRQSEKFRKHQSEAGKVMTEKRRKVIDKNFAIGRKMASEGENLKKRNEARRWWLESEENKIMLTSRIPKNAPQIGKANLNRKSKLVREVSRLGKELGYSFPDVGKMRISELNEVKAFLLDTAEKSAKIKE